MNRIQDLARLLDRHTATLGPGIHETIIKRAELRRTLASVWGRTSFDYLVNNAGSMVHKSFEETTESDFDAMLGVHLKGVYFLHAGVVAAAGR